MPRLLMLGNTPPPYLGDHRIEAAHYRTWQFLDPVVDAGTDVCLCVPSLEHSTGTAFPLESGHGLRIVPVPFHKPFWMRRLQEIHDAFRPDCIAAINIEFALYATRLKTTRPVWMDIYGDYLTIVQAGMYRARSNRGWCTSIQQMRSILLAGDVFSTCSTAQEHALVGELAMAGRLIGQTFGYAFTRVVLPGSPPEPPAEAPDAVSTRRRELGFTDDDFIVLWCGGYNTWTDCVTLFRGLERAMDQNPRLHFLSIGASTYTATDSVYDEFLRLIERSASRDRYHMLGWRPWKEVRLHYLISHLGINIDASHYETTYGTRTRLVEMIASGLPVLTTEGTDLSGRLMHAGAAITFPIGDWRALGDTLIRVAADPSLLAGMAGASLRCAHNELSFQNTTLPFRHWIGNPAVAPDRLTSGRDSSIRCLEFRLRSMVRALLWRGIGLYK
jgi:glycosyltransferase involved in cell wall biosynthesis